MKLTKRLITLDAHVFVAALKKDEPYSKVVVPMVANRDFFLDVLWKMERLGILCLCSNLKASGQVKNCA